MLLSLLRSIVVFVISVLARSTSWPQDRLQKLWSGKIRQENLQPKRYVHYRSKSYPADANTVHFIMPKTAFASLPPINSL